MKKGIYIVNLKKPKQVYVTVLLYFLYSLWVHIKRLKYEMIFKKQVNLLF